MQRIKKQTEYFIFDNLEKTQAVNHCFSTRLGGVSENGFKSLNLSFGRGDDKEKVYENFRRIASDIGTDIKNMVCVKQVHGTKIKHVSKADCGKGFNLEEDFIGYDALITNEEGVCLVTFHADCVPIFFADPDKKVIALAHSGWRGTVNDIAGKTVSEMEKAYGCRAEDIICAVGPSIGRCCFEVDRPVVDEFVEKLPWSLWDITGKEDENEDKYYIDLWQINKRLLTEAGILEKNIEITDLCTKCSEGLFYSHRLMGERRGSMAAFLELKARA